MKPASLVPKDPITLMSLQKAETFIHGIQTPVSLLEPPPQQRSGLDSQDQETVSMTDLDPQQFHMPLLPFLTDPMTHITQWWSLFHQYYKQLLRLHPDHPHTLKPEDLDPSLLQGPVAQIVLLFRNILESSRHPGVRIREGLPEWVYQVLPYTKCLQPLEFWEGILMILMPCLITNTTTSNWNTLLQSLRWISYSMEIPSHTISNFDQTTSGSMNTPIVKREEVVPELLKPPLITQELAQEIRLFRGELWNTDKSIRIEIPTIT
jgi:hypothetical protein